MQTTSVLPPVQMQTTSVPPTDSSNTEIQESSNMEIQTTTVLPTTEIQESSNIEIQTNTVLPTVEQNPADNREKNEKRTKEERLNEMRNAMIVMASLIITLTFQIAISPPGGVWQDWASTPAPGTKHEPGKVILYDLARSEYKLLMSANMETFICSVLIILLLVRPLGTNWFSSHWLPIHSAISAALFFLTIEFFLITSLTTPGGLVHSFRYIVGTISWTVFLCAFIFASPWITNLIQRRLNTNVSNQ